MTFNMALAKRILNLLEAKPELHRQEVWAWHDPTCGTAGCIAGWATILSGRKPNYFRDNTAHYVFDLDDDDLYIGDLARDLLGISREEAGDLFASEVDDIYECELGGEYGDHGRADESLWAKANQLNNERAIERLKLLIEKYEAVTV